MQMSRKKIPVAVAIDPDLHAQVDAWIGAQLVPPSRTSVVELALRQFLANNPEKVGDGNG